MVFTHGTQWCHTTSVRSKNRFFNFGPELLQDGQHGQKTPKKCLDLIFSGSVYCDGVPRAATWVPSRAPKSCFGPNSFVCGRWASSQRRFNSGTDSDSSQGTVPLLLTILEQFWTKVKKSIFSPHRGLTPTCMHDHEIERGRVEEEGGHLEKNQNPCQS